MPAEYPPGGGSTFTIPVSTDVADGPAAFRAYTDDLDARLDAMDAAIAVGGVFRVFTDQASMNAWDAPLGARANLVMEPNAFDPDVVVPFTRALNVGARVWFPELRGYVESTSGTVTFLVPFPYEPQFFMGFNMNPAGGTFRLTALSTTEFSFVASTAGPHAWMAGLSIQFD